MTEPTIPASHADLLEQQLTAVLTTIDAEGRPQSTAVWFAVEDSTVKVNVASTTRKHKNMAGDPRATLFIFDPTNPFRTLEIRADVTLATDPDRMLLEQIATRYGVSGETFGPPNQQQVAVTFNPTRIVALG